MTGFLNYNSTVHFFTLDLEKWSLSSTDKTICICFKLSTEVYYQPGTNSFEIRMLTKPFLMHTFVTTTSLWSKSWVDNIRMLSYKATRIEPFGNLFLTKTFAEFNYKKKQPLHLEHKIAYKPEDKVRFIYIPSKHELTIVKYLSSVEEKFIETNLKHKLIKIRIQKFSKYPWIEELIKSKDVYRLEQATNNCLLFLLNYSKVRTYTCTQQRVDFNQLPLFYTFQKLSRLHYLHSSFVEIKFERQLYRCLKYLDNLKEFKFEKEYTRNRIRFIGRTLEDYKCKSNLSFLYPFYFRKQLYLCYNYITPKSRQEVIFIYNELRKNLAFKQVSAFRSTYIKTFYFAMKDHITY